MAVADFRMSMNFVLRACFTTALLLLFRTSLPAADAALKVVNAGVQAQDNEALAPSDYKFLPGDALYVVFATQGFRIEVNEEKDTRFISLAWEISVLDQEDVLLAPAQKGEIKTSLSAEDKKWMPKRRAEFSLPSSVTAGQYRVHIVIKDLLAGAEAVKDLSFLIGGVSIEPSATVNIQRVKLAREEDGPNLEIAAYRPGATIYISFDIAGFSQTATREYRVSYRFEVFGPDGKSFVHQSEAAELSAASFYPAKFVLVNFSLSTPAGSARGNYSVLVTATDEISKQSSESRFRFTIE